MAKCGVRACMRLEGVWCDLHAFRQRARVHLHALRSSHACLASLTTSRYGLTQGNVTVTGNDLTVVAGGMAAISVRQLAADVEALKSATAVLQNLTARFPTTQEASSNNPNMHEAMQRASRPQVRQQKNITVLPD
jgi:hypothetical protein